MREGHDDPDEVAFAYFVRGDEYTTLHALFKLTKAWHRQWLELKTGRTFPDGE